MIVKNCSKLIELDENLMKTKFFVRKIIQVTFGDINVFDLKYLKFNQFLHVVSVLESSGQADFRTVPGFVF